MVATAGRPQQQNGGPVSNTALRRKALDYEHERLDSSNSHQRDLLPRDRYVKGPKTLADRGFGKALRGLGVPRGGEGRAIQPPV